MCWGRILNDQNSLESYGIKNGTLIILKPKTALKNDDAKLKNDNFDISNEPSRETLEKAFHFRHELKRLNKHCFPFARCLKNDENCRDKFMKSFPELSSDPSLFAVFTEISTISALLDTKYLHSTLSRYPTFLAVTEHFIELWKKELAKNPNANAELNNLFFLTDDEDEAEGQQGGPQQGPSSSRSGGSQQNRPDIQNMARGISSLRNLRRALSAQQQQQQQSGSHITPGKFQIPYILSKF